MQKYGELLGELLARRGITAEAEAEAILNPEYRRDIHDPFLMRDMEHACVRLFEAVEAKEKIIIYADYDCDGIPGAVMLRDLFKRIGFENYEVYIPERNSEGYGLNLAAIKEFAGKGARLIITVDLGTTAVSEIAQAKVLNIDTIVTDHHIPPAELPRACAILNPKVDGYPEKMLCGAGVVFKFIQGFIKKYGEFYKIGEGWEKWLLDMAGLATLSDQVPLTGENRAIAYFGMKVLRKSPRPGLQKIFSKLYIEQRHVSEDDIGFMLTPRLNAASRMDSPRLAYELLATSDDGEAGALAARLSKINDDRKTVVTSIVREVHKKLEAREAENLKEVLVIGNPVWRVGVLGLVAGKMKDQYKKPVFVWGRDENDLIKGSCRSDGSVSVVELMQETREFFSEFGGHELAGGFTVRSEKIHSLEEALCFSFTKVKREKKEEGVPYDIKSGLEAVNMKNWKEISKLAPFGLGNPKPVFLFEGVKVENIKKFGKNGGEHLEITFSGSGKSGVKAVSFFSNGDSFKTPVTLGSRVNLLASLDLSRFGGREELRLRVIDIL